MNASRPSVTWERNRILGLGRIIPCRLVHPRNTSKAEQRACANMIVGREYQ